VDHQVLSAEFTRIITPFKDQLYRVAFRFTGSKELAEDLVQTTLTKLFPKTEQLLTLDKPGPWIIQVMHRQFIDDLRRYQRSPVTLIDDVNPGTAEQADMTDPYDGVASQEMGPEESSMLAEKQAKLKVAWLKLSTNHRIILSLHDIEGYTLAELAESLETPIGTLKSRLNRARGRFREILLEPF